ncbi:hypothetical protein BN1195_02456 [Chryseobacterium oranimense G311]|nr:hypothetical protein BN1195_02456 [Chryseobacterium oranimense G311]
MWCLVWNEKIASIKIKEAIIKNYELLRLPPKPDLPEPEDLPPP